MFCKDFQLFPIQITTEGCVDIEPQTESGSDVQTINKF